MSYGAAEQALIDVDEFERRVRGPAPRPTGDPLANLARLVTPASVQPEALDRMFAHPPKAETAPIDPAYADDHMPSDDVYAAGLRGAVHDEESFGHEFHAKPLGGNERAYHEAAAPIAEDQWATEAGYEPSLPTQRAARSRRPLYATAAVIAVGLLGIGSTFAFKSTRSVSGDLVEVKALPGPTKIQGADASRATNDATVLDKGAASTPVTKVVDRQERPVDLKDAVAKAPRVVSTSQSDGYASSQMASLAGAAASGNDSTPGSRAEPRKVKTVSVRPDGSIVGNASMGSPSTSGEGTPSTASQTSAPKSATPKVVARVATTPKPPADRPEAVAKPATPKLEVARPVTPKPTRVARVVEPDDNADTDATPVATTTARSAGGGGFSVQLAAPGNEADAKSTASRLGQKFSDELGGARVTVQKASDKAVYRVRTASMSREDAVAACEKVKAAGGSCFVAKN